MFGSRSFALLQRSSRQPVVDLRLYASYEVLTFRHVYSCRSCPSPYHNYTIWANSQQHSRRVFSTHGRQRPTTADSLGPFHNPRNQTTKPFTTTQPEVPQADAQPSTTLAPYLPPKTGLLSYLPSSWVPYAELMRLDKPAGTYYLFFPCLFSTLLAASYSSPPVIPVVTTTLLFFSGALVMRGAGCTINDLWDRNLDPHVVRTRLRPIARRAVTPFKALTFTGFQLLAGLGILLQFPTSCLYYGIPSLILVAIYPLAKRVTHYPQFVLGLTFSWGAIMGFPALGIDILSDTAAMKAVTALYASCVSWTVLYDMIYAHMDIKDDAKVGIKSIALRHEKETKTVLSVLAVFQIGLLATAGAAIGASPVFFMGSCGSAACTLGIMIWKVKLKEVSNCWWWFRNGAWLTGGGIAGGLLAEYLMEAPEDIVARQVSAKQQALQKA